MQALRCSSQRALLAGQVHQRRRGAAAPAASRRQAVRLRATAATPLEGASAAVPELSPQDANAREFAVACASVVDETKCQDISVLHVAPTVSWTSYMVLATVFSRPQLLAAIARLENMVAEDYPDRERQNQPGSSPWECLDFGDVVVHLFTAEQRETYDLESFYAAAEEVDLPWAVDASDPGGAKPTWSKQYQ